MRVYMKLFLFIINMTKLEEPERERSINFFCTEFTAETC